MIHTYKITNDNSLVRITELTTKRIRHALKTHYTRKGIKLEEKIFATKRFCAFCGEQNNTWFFKFEMFGKNITIVGIGHKRDVDYCFKSKNNCPGKKYNPNSAEFISRINGITLEAAIEVIHSRNKSPFYRNNHDDDDSYKKYQSSWTRLDDDKKALVIQKANFSRSLEGYIKKYGDEGQELWRNVQKTRAITLENMQKAYGESEGIIRYERWKKLVAPSIENYTLKYGDEGYLMLRKRIQSFFLAKGGQYFSPVTIEDGNCLRSNLERKFYRKVKELFPNIKIISDSCYEKSIKRSDFYFPDIDLHVEIVGMDKKFEEYWQNLEEKIKQFNPLVLYKHDVLNDEKLLKAIQNIYRMHCII